MKVVYAATKKAYGKCCKEKDLCAAHHSHFPLSPFSHFHHNQLSIGVFCFNEAAKHAMPQSS